jgi:hypothetical protein
MISVYRLELTPSRDVAEDLSGDHPRSNAPMEFGRQSRAGQTRFIDESALRR